MALSLRYCEATVAVATRDLYEEKSSVLRSDGGQNGIR